MVNQSTINRGNFDHPYTFSDSVLPLPCSLTTEKKLVVTLEVCTFHNYFAFFIKRLVLRAKRHLMTDQSHPVFGVTLIRHLNLLFDQGNLAEG